MTYIKCISTAAKNVLRILSAYCSVEQCGLWGALVFSDVKLARTISITVPRDPLPPRFFEVRLGLVMVTF